MLFAYDHILKDIFLNKGKNTQIIIATGLSQRPFDELKFYYRLKDHKSFLDRFKFSYKEVFPRMTRDFLVTFDSEESAKNAQNILEEVLVDGETRLFDEIDNRGKDLFVVLTYPKEITSNTIINLDDRIENLKKFTTFVAIKNGEHQSKGFAYFSEDILRFAPNQGDHVAGIFKTVMSYFGVKT